MKSFMWSHGALLFLSVLLTMVQHTTATDIQLRSQFTKATISTTFNLFQKGDKYQIRAKGSDDCLAVSGQTDVNGGVVVFVRCSDNNEYNLWYLNGQYPQQKFRLAANDKVLDGRDFSPDDGYVLQVWDDIDHSVQVWETLSSNAEPPTSPPAAATAADTVSEEDVSIKYFQMTSFAGFCVDIHESSSQNGAYAKQWDCKSGAKNQRFRIVPVDDVDGDVQIQAEHSGMCLGVEDGQNGFAPVRQFDCSTTSPYLLWTMIERGMQREFHLKNNGYALDLGNQSEQKGMVLAVYPDQPGAASQQWEIMG